MNAWKWIGLAGVAGVAAAGVVTTRKRRAWANVDPNEIRTQLHERLGESERSIKATPPAGPDGSR